MSVEHGTTVVPPDPPVPPDPVVPPDAVVPPAAPPEAVVLLPRTAFGQERSGAAGREHEAEQGPTEQAKSR